MSPRKFHFDEAQERRLIAAIASGATERALAARFGCSPGVIQNKLKELRANGRLGDAPSDRTASDISGAATQPLSGATA